MSDKKTLNQSSSKGKKGYISPSTGKDITEANYICELICERKAKLENKGTLPKNYWNIPKYKAHYRSQITKISQLLHKYSGISIINAIKNCPKVYSLRPKWFEEKIKKEESILQRDLKNRKTIEVTVLEKREKPKADKKNLFGEL